MANLTITNLTTNNISLSGDKGVPRISLSSAVGANTYTLNAQLCLGNEELCDGLSSLITASAITVVDAASNTLTAAQIESYKSGTYWDKDDDAQLDYSEGGVIHATTLKATPVAADELLIEDSAASWAKKRATLTSVATAAAALNPCISTADGTINALANKAVPIGADVLLVEDSAAADAQKNITITDLATAIAVISPPGQERVVVSGISPETLNNEQSQALTGSAANEWVPCEAIVHMEDVGAGVAASGDFQITIGTASGGTQILAATACTGVIGLNTKLVIPLTTAMPAIPGDSTIYVKVTTADSTAGAAHLVDVYLRGETFVSGT